MKPMARVHKFRIRILNKYGVVMYEEEPVDMMIGDKLTYGPATFGINIDGRYAGEFEGSIEVTWMPPAMATSLLDKNWTKKEPE